MKYGFTFFILLLLYVSCTKSGSKPPEQTPPVDTVITTPPKDTTTAPPKDTTTTPPTDTTTAPPKDTTTSVMIYKTIVTNRSIINWVSQGQYYIKYFNDEGGIAQVNSYLATDATLSSHNLGNITVTLGTNVGDDQLLTSSKFTDKANTATASASDTAKFYYLLLTRNDTTTIIFPNMPIHYRNFLQTVTETDEKIINNRAVQVEKLAFQ